MILDRIRSHRRGRFQHHNVQTFSSLFKAAPAGPLGRTVLIPSGRGLTASSLFRSGKRAGPGLRSPTRARQREVGPTPTGRDSDRPAPQEPRTGGDRPAQLGDEGAAKEGSPATLIPAIVNAGSSRDEGTGGRGRCGRRVVQRFTVAHCTASPNAPTSCSRPATKPCAATAAAPGVSATSSPPHSSCSTTNMDAPYDQQQLITQRHKGLLGKPHWTAPRRPVQLYTFG